MFHMVVSFKGIGEFLNESSVIGLSQQNVRQIRKLTDPETCALCLVPCTLEGSGLSLCSSLCPEFAQNRVHVVFPKVQYPLIFVKQIP